MNARYLGIALLAGTFAMATWMMAGPATAAVSGNLVTCSDASNGVDIGDAKFSPGLQLLERKQVITATVSLSGCTANEAELDEIASESKFGVTKTAAAGRLPITGGAAKVKVTMWADCLGLILPDPDDTGEYPAWGTFQVKWQSSGATVTGTTPTTAVIRLAAAGVSATTIGIVSKGLGVGSDFQSSSQFAPRADDDANQNGTPDFTECVVAAEPSAVGKLLDVTSPASLSIDLP